MLYSYLPRNVIEPTKSNIIKKIIKKLKSVYKINQNQ